MNRSKVLLICIGLLLPPVLCFSRPAVGHYLEITSNLRSDSPAHYLPACEDFSVTAAGNGPICEGEDIQLMAAGADSYTWTGPAGFSSNEQNPTIANVARAYSGTYRLIAAATDGCRDTVEVEVLVNRLPTFTAVEMTPLTCEITTTTVTVNATGAGALEYSTDGINFDTAHAFPGLSSGSYSFFARDTNGCVGRYNLTIVPESGPVINSLGITPPDCGADNGAILITASGGAPPLAYSIDGGNTFQNDGLFELLSPGSYDILVRDSSGCSITAGATLAGGEDPPVIDEIRILQTACATDQNSIAVVVAGDQAGLEYAINGVDFQSSNRFTGLLPGNYPVTVRDQGGCSVTEQVTIAAIDVLFIDQLAVRPADCLGNGGRIELGVGGGIGPLVFALNDSLVQEEAVFTGLGPGVYRLSVTDNSGCSLSREAIILRGDCPIFIANAFSPNGDGVNDEFTIFAANGVNGQVVSYQIYSRWGELVFQSGGFPLGDPGQWWNGMLRGQAAPGGVYVYSLVIELEGGERLVERGEVNLLR